MKTTAVGAFYQAYSEKVKEMGLTPLDEKTFNAQVDFGLYDYFPENVFEHPEQLSEEDWKTVMSW